MGNNQEIIRGDATTRLMEMSSDAYDVIITDPAYDALEKHRARGTTVRLAAQDDTKGQWFQTVPDSYFPAFFAECKRILKKGSHLYVMANADWMWAAKPMGEAAGFKFHKAIMWNKVKIGMGYHYRCQYEAVLFFSKPGAKDRKLNNLGMSDFRTYDENGEIDVFNIPRIRSDFPTAKPIQLYQDLIEQSTQPGDWVVGPFSGGAGTGAIAAYRSGRKFTGIELEDKYVNSSQTNLGEYIQQAEKAKETP